MLLVFSPVYFSVTFESGDVINGFLGDGHHEYEDQRCHISKHEADFEGRDKLGEGDNQEEQVEEELKLVVENDWNQG